MTFMRINGWRVVAAEKKSQSKNIFSHGELDPRWRNRPTRNRRSLETSFSVSTIKQDELCADNLEGLLEGQGDHFSFVVDVWSESGLGPELGSTWTLHDTGGPLATKGFYVEATGTGIVYNPEFIDDQVAPDGGRWSIIYWFLNGATWERHCLRSDGTGFVDGISDSPSGVVVSNGGVVISAGSEIADLSLLPYYVCDGFASDDFDWVSGHEVVNRWSFDESFTDDVGRRFGGIVTSPPVGPVSFSSGIAGRAAFLNGSTASLQPLSDALSSATEGKEALSLHVWAFASSLPGVGEKHYLIDSLVGLNPKVQITLNENGAVEVIGDPDSTDSVSASTSAGAVIVDKWFLYSAIFDLASNVLSLYLNGILVARTSGGWSRTDWFGGVVLNSFFAGKESQVGLAATHWHGKLCELRLFERAHSIQEVIEIYKCERWGKRFPVARQSSSLPRLDAWGDFEGCAKPIEVLGAVDGEDYVGHGSADGWVDNARETSGTIDGVKRSPSIERIPDPIFGWTMAREYLSPTSALATLQPSAGASTMSNVGVVVDKRDQLGPYSTPLSAAEFDGASKFSTSSLVAAQSLIGASSVSILAWVRAGGAGGVEMSIFEIAVTNTSTAKLSLVINNGDEAELRARSESADALQSLIATPGDLSDDKWHLVGGDVDFENGIMRAYFDGVQVASSSKVFGLTRMDDDFISPIRIADRPDNSNPLTGFLASVNCWGRSLTSGEHRRIFELGREEVF